MPGKNRGRSAMWPPCFANFANLPFIGSLRQSHDLADIDLDGKVARRPDVRPAFREEQVDLGRPAADALHLRQKCNRFFIVGRQVVKIQRTALDQLGKTASIALLLT